VTSKHTPGPWQVQHNRRLEIVPADDERDGHAGHWRIIAQVYKSGKVNANRYTMPAEANAKVIAAAPTSLEACQAFIDWLDVCDTPESEQDRAWFLLIGEMRQEAERLAREAIATGS
jgi:hypothetical protein